VQSRYSRRRALVQIFRWAITEVLKAASFVERTRVLSRLLRISQVCYKLRDFTACAAVTKGLERIEAKLKNTWKAMAPKAVEWYQQMKDISGSVDRMAEEMNPIMPLPTIPSIRTLPI